MKPTNYHLFDFLDFDPDLSRDESLWKAYKPTSVYEKDGDIWVSGFSWLVSFLLSV